MWTSCDTDLAKRARDPPELPIFLDSQLMKRLAALREKVDGLRETVEQKVQDKGALLEKVMCTHACS